MVRQFVLACVVGSLVAAGFAAQGCVVGTVSLGTNCDPAMPIDCCQCPWPEDCPPFRPPRSIPDWCRPYLIDAGCPELYTHDPTLCEPIDAGADDADSGMSSFCSSGTCVPPAPQAWAHVSFVMSWPELPPACPEDAPILAFEGNPAPPERSCPACSCDAPEGSCHMPATWTVSTEPCANPGGGIKTSFDAPTNWDGMCSNNSAIPKDKLCGGVPCVRSITISPPIIEEKPCTPHTEGAVDLPVLKAWNGGERWPVGRACMSDKPAPTCSGQGCAAKNSAFGPCIMREGDQVCPDGWTGERHLLYGHIEDSRECTPCGCDEPKGGTCQVKWRTFSDSTCSTENAAGDIYANMISACHDYMPGVALAGKTAALIDYTKGSCAPTGGESTGALALQQPHTVCCYASTM